MNTYRFVPILVILVLLTAVPPAASIAAPGASARSPAGRLPMDAATPGDGPSAPAPASRPLPIGPTRPTGLASSNRPVATALTGPVLHDTHTVTSTQDSGPGSLRQALFDASPGDTIGFSLTYPVTITLTSGELAITKSLTLLGPGPENLAVTGNHTSRVLSISGVSTTVTLSGLTVADGFTHYGGGIRNGGTLVLTNTTFSGNNACCEWATGGGIWNGGVLTVTNSTFSGNWVTIQWGDGGGIWNNGMLTVTHAAFSGNWVTSQWGDGGGIWNNGRLMVTNATFSGNGASSVGGGIANGGALTVAHATFSGNSAVEGGSICNWGTLTVTNATFSGNSAYYGGGICNWGTLTVTHATFSGNSAGQGGGIANFAGMLTVTNATFSGNGASYGGGGICNWGTLAVTNATFSGNSAYYGGGICNWRYSTLTVINATFPSNSATNGGGIYIHNEATLNLRSTIIANSAGGADCLNAGTIGQNVANLIEDGSCDPQYSGDPNLGPLGDYGGDTWTHPLIPPSLAIDHGDPATCPPTDQRGYPRYGPCDIGAFEFTCIPVGGADFSWLPLTPTVGQAVTFTGTVAAGDGPISYTWKLDDGSWKEGPVVTHTYNLPGLYTVWLTATNCATATATASHTLTVVCPDVADAGFTWTPAAPEAGTPVTFTATASSTRPLTYTWKLEDGSWMEGPVVTHSYALPGLYPVVMTATNDCGARQAVADTVVVVCPDVADAGFTWTPAAPEAGTPVTFTATASSTRPLTYAWKLDVGSWMEGQVVTHTYDLPGLYTVTLTATNDCGSWQAVTDTVVVTSIPCQEVSIVSVTMAIAGCEVTFGAELAGDPPFNYLWDFGPFGISTVTNPLVDFGVDGTYTGTLNVWNCGNAEPATGAFTVEVACFGEYSIYLPIVLRNYP